VPIDPYTGESMLYQQRDGGYVLYCTGPDKVDDGGTERIDLDTGEGDLIIWPWGRVNKARETSPE